MRPTAKRLSLLVLFFATSLFSSPSFALTDKIYKNLETFTRIIEIVDKEYVDQVDEKKLVDGAIRGMLESLDPYTIYMSAETYKSFHSDTTGVFGGVGLEVSLKDGILTVVAPIDDSPAFKSGVKSGDKIVKIDGESTKNMTVYDGVKKMRGPKGKKVVLNIWREGFQEPKDFVVIREIIKVNSIKSERLDAKTVYLRISSFQENTTDDLKAALEKLEKSGSIKGIVLDLRDNPGGLLTEAVTVSSLFMKKGVVVSTKSRNQEPEFKSNGKDGPYSTIPIVVMVNHGSASAAEIVSGALQDTKRAKLLGTQSYGKGSVQTLIPMEGNTALKITIAKYYTPSGRSINGKGVTPDIIVDQALLKKEVPADKVGKEVDPEDPTTKTPKGKVTLQDFQKKKAIEALKRMM